jgi:hypothetical protein
MLCKKTPHIDADVARAEQRFDWRDAAYADVA